MKFLKSLLCGAFGGVLAAAASLIITFSWAKLATMGDPSGEGAYVALWLLIVGPLSLIAGAAAGFVYCWRSLK